MSKNTMKKLKKEVTYLVLLEKHCFCIRQTGSFFSKEMTNERGHFISNWAMIEDELLGPLFSSTCAI